MEYRFHLEKYKNSSSKHVCPKCGHKGCFVRYIDTAGEITFPDNVGRCDRENNCGYHYTPKQYFHDNPDMKEKIIEHTESAKVSKVPHTARPKVEPYFFDKNLMLATEKAYGQNPLCSFLGGILGMDTAISQMRMYNTGTTKNGGTAYWLMDCQGRLRDCKIMFYDASTGHRLKDEQHHPTWLHSKMRIDKERVRLCFFGEHLLSLEENKKKTIAIVESEKTAIVASFYLPQFVWIATGGKDGVFSQADLSVLHDRKVMLFPDLGMLSNWREKMMKLVRHGIDATVFEFLEKEASEADRKAGLDIADYLLNRSPTKPETKLTQGQMAFEKLKGINHAIAKLADALGLEVVDAKYSDETVSASMTKARSASKEVVAAEKANTAIAKLKVENESQWHGRNRECHECRFSHEGINGTYCDKLGRYAEYGKGDCGNSRSPPL